MENWCWLFSELSQLALPLPRTKISLDSQSNYIAYDVRTTGAFTFSTNNPLYMHLQAKVSLLVNSSGNGGAQSIIYSLLFI